jgi:hypothetical protein
MIVFAAEQDRVGARGDPGHNDDWLSGPPADRTGVARVPACEVGKAHAPPALKARVWGPTPRQIRVPVPGDGGRAGPGRARHSGSGAEGEDDSHPRVAREREAVTGHAVDASGWWGRRVGVRLRRIRGPTGWALALVLIAVLPVLLAKRRRDP